MKSTEPTAFYSGFSLRGIVRSRNGGSDCAECSCEIPCATLIEDENFARFRNEKCKNQWFWHNANEKCYVVPSESAKVRGQI